MNQDITLLILIEVKPNHRQEQIDAFEKLAPIVRQEVGCLQYELKEVMGNENEFVLLERWASEDDLLVHDVTAHMVEADKVSPSFRAKPARVIKLVDIS